MSLVANSHRVHFYGSDERSLVKSVCTYFAEGLKCREKVLCIATPEHRDAFLQQLRTHMAQEETALDVQLTFVDARQTMCAFMRKGGPDPVLFANTIRPLLAQIATSGGSPGGRAYGEIVGLLWKNGDLEAAIRVEQLWNELLQRSEIPLMCGYPTDVLSGQFHSPEMRAILAEHSELVYPDFVGQMREAMESFTCQHETARTPVNAFSDCKSGDVLSRDISENERNEIGEKLWDSARPEGLGVLAAGFARDLNNLLTGIHCSAKTVLQKVPQECDISSSIEAIARASERASEITKQMLVYAGRGSSVLEPVNFAHHTRGVPHLQGASNTAISASVSPQSDTYAQKVAGAMILMVDDDDVLLRVGKLVLERLQFTVLLARNGDQLVEQFERNHGELALVILDTNMPGLAGEEALSRMKAIDPSVPVLASSGYGIDDAHARFGSGIAGFLQKPYAIQHFSEMVLSTARSRRRHG